MAKSTAAQAVSIPPPDGLIASASEAAPAPQPPQHAEAAEYLAHPRFNRRLTLPATDDHDPLTVTYAVAGAQSDSAQTVLLIGGLMGGRSLAMLGDFLSEKRGLRFVAVDRPGMGGSTKVDVSQRIAVWLEIVPVLMKELNAEHVSIFSHSCGVIYALNTVYAYPDILPPSNPTLHFLSPWVHPRYSGVKMMQFSSMLPSPLINQFSAVASFVSQNIAPSLAFSGAALTSATGMLSSNGRSRKKKHERDDLCREFQGVSAAEAAALNDQMMRRLFKEDTSGANGESLLSFRKPEAGSWGVCDDYEKCPGLLEARMSERLGEQQVRGEPSAAPVLSINVFWAETDMMIGKKGQEYFDKCFGDHCGGQSRMRYRSETVAEADHDTLCHPQYGALSKALDGVLVRQ